MSERLPGRRLYRVLERIVDQGTFRAVITPIFADLDHEVRAGDERSPRWRAHLRCYGALARVWLSGELGVISLRQLAVVIALMVAGVVATFWTMHVMNTPPFVPFLIMLVAAPIFLRTLAGRRTFGGMFWNCLGIGLPMIATVVAYYSAEYQRTTSLSRPFLILSALAAMICIFAAAASTRASAGETVWARAGRAVAIGTAAFVVARLGPAYWQEWQRDELEVRLLFGAALSAVTFALATTVFHMPIVIAASRFLASRWSLALAAGLLCPAPMLGLDFFTGEMGPDWFYGEYATGSLAKFVSDAPPYLIATAIIGWSYAKGAKIPHAPHGVLPDDAADPRPI